MTRTARPRPVRVAIDGPGGVGKTTTARALARELNLLYVDTGAMYRALAVLARERGVSPEDGDGAAALAQESTLRLAAAADGGVRVEMNGRDVTAAIRTPEASDGASRISVHPGVRRELVRWQREMARHGGVVMEGRDIGTVVLPDAEAKVFLTASAEERARRRHRELAARGLEIPLAEVLADLEARDARDRGREASPLRPAPDAVVLDCTALNPQAQVAAVRKVVETLVALRSGRFE
jgi:cytidylate kinase